MYIWCVYGHAFVAWDSLASPLKNASPSGNVGKKKELSDIGAMHRSFPDLEDLHLAHHLSYSLWDFTVLSAFKMSFRLSSVSKSPSVPSGRVLLDPLGPLIIRRLSNLLQFFFFLFLFNKREALTQN